MTVMEAYTKVCELRSVGFETVTKRQFLRFAKSSPML